MSDSQFALFEHVFVAIACARLIATRLRLHLMRLHLCWPMYSTPGSPPKSSGRIPLYITSLSSETASTVQAVDEERPLLSLLSRLHPSQLLCLHWMFIAFPLALLILETYNDYIRYHGELLLPASSTV